MISPEEEDAYRAKASGMGQTRGMSIVSSEEDLKASKRLSEKDGKLIGRSDTGKTENTNNSREVDFFNDRDYYKIFLETSKE